MVRYSEELIEDIRANNDIVDVISQYVTLKRSGRSYFGLCPFHKEKTPSFSVSVDKQIFHCFGCGAGGNVIHFIQKIENIDFKESIELLAERAGIVLPTETGSSDDKKQRLKEKIYDINQQVAMFYHENLYKPTAKLGQEYVKKRKLDNKALKNFLIGYADSNNSVYKFLKEKGFTEEEILESRLVNKTEKGVFIDRYRNRLIFPIQDVRGRVVAFGGRVLDNSLPKYINSPENLVYNKSRTLYGLNVAKNSKKREMIMVEGYMDTVSLHQRGIDNVVASCGTALTEAQGRMLKKYCDKVIISYDSDTAGQNATLRGLEILKNLGCDVRILQMEGAKDPDEFVIKYGTGKFNLLIEKAISLIEFRVKVLKNNVNLDNANDKIKFLKEIAKILSTVDNKIEQEIYLVQIAETYNISKEAIYAEINKLNYNKNVGQKVLERPKVVKKVEKKIEPSNKREELIILLLLNGQMEIFNQIKQKISPQEFKVEVNKRIVETLYKKYEEEKQDITNVLDLFSEDEEAISMLTKIMSSNDEIKNDKKAVDDVINSYIKEKLTNRKNEIIYDLNNSNVSNFDSKELENELHDIIIKLAQIK
ncbi:MAG: DNA primase [Clostridiales bacterium]|nr:DNA primase [Clostridiales bacterium]